MTPHQRIIRAAARGTGLQLTEDEVWELKCDDAIEAVAINDCLDEGRCTKCFKLSCKDPTL